MVFSGLPPATPVANYSDAIVGQMYYNSTSGSFKAIKTAVGSWSSGGNLNTARKHITLAGTQTAAIVAGGYLTSPDSITSASEEYNGSSWSEGNNLNLGRIYHSTFGTQTAAVLVSGLTLSPTTYRNESESYDGTSWSEGNNLNTARHNAAMSFGVQTAAIVASGDAPPYTTNVESYDGTSYTEITNVNTGRQFGGSAGVSTDGLI